MKTRSTRSRCLRLRIRSQSRHSLRAVRTKRSAMALAFGARVGVRTISRPSLRKTASKLEVYLLSRSRIKKRKGAARSAIDQASWRACWVTQMPLGFAVRPARCTRRLPSSMKKSTYNRRSETVSTVKKSTASMLWAWRPQKVAPGKPCSLAGRTQARLAEQLAHRGCGDGEAQPVKLAGDPLVSPARILAREAEHKLTDLAPDRRTTRSTRVRPASVHQEPMPTKQGRRRDHE